ncbi:DoxX family protein [Nocardia uniformis]|uniref:DoxX family protein n=1 Tax=Nocardia uniformis TaxID=53432 RepID=A0A849CBV0_9NOCA|nr:DoxX family protein [Nocardia uniformis]NNH73467.1 DoxX family protein [Nocardia uniformis]
METAYYIVGVIAALWIGFSSFSLLSRKSFVVEPLIEYGVPQAWWNLLGIAKGAGALGLIVGFVIPAIGIAAAIGLILYFAGAVGATLRVGSYKTTPFPLLYMAPAIATLVLQLAA